MKKSSLYIASAIMLLAVVVAMVGVTAAWFDGYDYQDGPINVSSADPDNNAIIVPDSESSLPTGEDAIFAPARLQPGLITNDVDGSNDYDKIEINKDNGFGADLSGDIIAKPAVPVTVQFDFVYNGAPSNPDGITTKMKIELVSITLENPLKVEDKVLENYRDEFAVEMHVITEDDDVLSFNSANNKYYNTKERELDDGTKETYFQLDEAHIVRDASKPYEITFDMIPVVNTLEAEIWFIHVDEVVRNPELMSAQLFLNFQVTFLTDKNNGEN